MRVPPPGSASVLDMVLLRDCCQVFNNPKSVKLICVYLAGHHSTLYHFQDKILALLFSVSKKGIKIEGVVLIHRVGI